MERFQNELSNFRYINEDDIIDDRTTVTFTIRHNERGRLDYSMAGDRTGGFIHYPDRKIQTISKDTVVNEKSSLTNVSNILDNM